MGKEPARFLLFIANISMENQKTLKNINSPELIWTNSK
jgi:hypothetical protein